MSKKIYGNSWVNLKVEARLINALKKLRSIETSIDQRLVKPSRASDGQSGLTITSFDCSDLKALNMETQA